MSSTKKEFNCYSCEYRNNIPGDAHSRCDHPEVNQGDNPFGALADMLLGKNIEASLKLKIKGNVHGIKKGWFMWPANFDPTWLENCEGYKKKDETKL